jgi:hypothetical protein
MHSHTFILIMANAVKLGDDLCSSPHIANGDNEELDDGVNEAPNTGG